MVPPRARVAARSTYTRSGAVLSSVGAATKSVNRGHGVLYTGLLSIAPIGQSSLTSAKKGSADLLILALVDEKPRHGYEIAQLIDQRSGGALGFTLASLYETLYRLEEQGHIRGRWVERAGQRRRRYYRITDTGRKMLAARREDWARFIAALTLVAGVKTA